MSGVNDIKTATVTDGIVVNANVSSPMVNAVVFGSANCSKPIATATTSDRVVMPVDNSVFQSRLSTAGAFQDNGDHELRKSSFFGLGCCDYRRDCIILDMLLLCFMGVTLVGQHWVSSAFLKKFVMSSDDNHLN